VVQGRSEALNRFAQAFEADLPPLAQVHRVSVSSHPLIQMTEFVIHSTAHQGALTELVVAPDRSVCERCLIELHDPKNRRYQDAFIQCSDCGPRYSVSRALPFERASTALAPFDLCGDCQTEYIAPEARRFHCQGLTCPVCGPSLQLYLADPTGEWVQRSGDQTQLIQQAVAQLQNGAILALKGLGGYHLICDPSQTAAVARLRQIKRRVAKPFALLCADLASAKKLAQVSPAEADWLTSAARPIVLLNKRLDAIGGIEGASRQISEQVAPDIQRLGIMLAYSPLHQLLFEQANQPWVATSANLAGEPIIYQFEQLRNQFAGLIDGVLDHNRDILHPCDDSIVQCINQQTYQTLRLGRGIAPLVIPLAPALHHQLEGWMGLGGQQKSTLALGLKRHIMLMPDSGDLSSLAALDRFEQQIQTALGFYQLRVKGFVADKHPDYASHRWGKARASSMATEMASAPAWQTRQHHYAHVLACMAEHQLDEPVIALVWDGSGLGEQGQIWGGELIQADRQGYQHLGGLMPSRLLGGELAIKQPKRIALAWLFSLLPLEAVLRLDHPAVKAFSEPQLRALHQLHQTGFNSPLSSSVGRLFDGVASWLGLAQTLDYEGQSGLLLEAYYVPSSCVASSCVASSCVASSCVASSCVASSCVASSCVASSCAPSDQPYPLALTPQGWDTPSLLAAIWQDITQGASPQQVVTRFFNALVNAVVEVSQRYPDNPLILSGGVFQNVTLMQQVVIRLGSRRFYFQQKTPINDGGLALGQVYSVWG
jgi:hydrogenase maturation protein HypF